MPAPLNVKWTVNSAMHDASTPARVKYQNRHFHRRTSFNHEWFLSVLTMAHYFDDDVELAGVAIVFFPSIIIRAHFVLISSTHHLSCEMNHPLWIQVRGPMAWQQYNAKSPVLCSSPIALHRSAFFPIFARGKIFAPESKPVSRKRQWRSIQ